MHFWKSEIKTFPVFLGTTEVVANGAHPTTKALIFPTAAGITGAY